MHAIEIKDDEQYVKAIEVLIEVGGWFHGRGREKRYLVVNDAQYEALVAAKVVQPPNTRSGSRGTKTRRAPKGKL